MKPTARPGAEPPVQPPGTVVLAAVIGAHGIGGAVRLKLFADDLTPPLLLNDGTLTLTALRSGGLARFVEINDRNAAEALRGTLLTVPRASLPPLREGEYYHADLIGLAAMSSTGETVGTVVGIENFGAGDIVEVERADGRRFMAPMHAVPGWTDCDLTIDAAFID